MKPFNVQQLAFSGGIALLLCSPAVAGVQDIREMQQQNNGTFRVLCTNQQQEVVSTSQITNNQVCNYRRDNRRDWWRDRRDDRRDDRWRDRDDRGRDLLSCKGNRFFDSVYITRNSDGRQLGGSMSQAQCQQAIDASRKGLVCTGSYYTDNVYVTRISDGQNLSGGFSVAQCFDSIKNGRDHYTY